MSDTACVVAAAPEADIVGRARTAATRALLERLSSLLPGSVYVLSPDPHPWRGLGVHHVPSPRGGFHWGREVAGLVADLSPRRLVYFSAGSGFLLGREELERFLSLSFPDPFAVFNNFYSVDFALISGPDPQQLAGLPADNGLGWALWRAGYRCYELPRGAATLLDIDTPGELQVLALAPSLPGELRDALAGVPRERAEALLEVLVSPGARLLIVGRTSGHLLRYLEREAACRVQALVEGRGMKAESLPARSLLREVLEAKGPRGLVRALARMGDVVVWDIRVLFGALGIWPERRERFALDLLGCDKLGDPLLRELAEAVVEAPVPFLLGGHSLVAGAMYLAVGLAWGRAGGEERAGRITRLEDGDDAGISEVGPRGG